MADLMEQRRKILLNSPRLVTVSGTNPLFYSDSHYKIKELKTEFLPIQSGSGTPSPTNIRPISGHQGLDISHSGKNLLKLNVNDIKSFYGSDRWNGNVYTYQGLTAELISDSAGNLLGINCSNSNSEGTRSFDIRVDNSFIGKTFRLSGGAVGGSGSTYRLILENFQPSATTIARVYTNDSVITTIPDNVSDVRVRIAITGVYENLYFRPMFLSMEDNENEFKPYSGNIYSVTFPQTFYGGYYDAVSGNLVQTMSIADLGDLDWEYSEDVNSFRTSSITDSKRFATADVMTLSKNICTKYKQVSRMLAGTSDYSFVLNSKTHYANRLYIKDPDFNADISAFKAGSAGEKIVYELAQPIVYQLTSPHILKTSVGINNAIGSSNGDISISYWIHKPHYTPGLPAEYTRLNYITESGYVSVIDTGVNGDNLDIELKFNHDTFAQWLAIFGNYVNTSTNAYRLLLGSNETQFYCLRNTVASSNRIISVNGGSINNDIIVRYDESGYTAISDGVATIGTPTTTAGTENARNIAIGYFAVTTSKISRTGKTKYYYCRIWRNSELIRNFIPCKRISDDKVGMYDLVTGNFFSSTTAQEFSDS